MRISRDLRASLVEFHITMKQVCVWEQLSKVLHLCEKNNLLTVERIKNSIVGVKYGTLGSLLRKNILNEWSSSIINNIDTDIFPVESHKVFYSRSGISTQFHKEDFYPDILNHYVDTLPLNGSCLPFGLILNRNFVNPKNNQNVANDEIIWDLKQYTHLAVVFFCSPKKQIDWFHYWQRQRYTWWRKFSALPAQFSLTDMTSSTAFGDQEVTLQWKFPWGNDVLEKISVNAFSHFKPLSEEIQNSYMSKDGNKSVLPSIVICQADLDLAILTYIIDAFRERHWQQKTTTVLKLHRKLAPYKASILLEQCEDESMKKLTDLATYQIKQLKKNKISILPNQELTSQVPLEEQFNRLDEMGVPYTIVLSANTLKLGILGLRNRDTTIQEQVHVTELIPKLQLYLQLK